VFAFRTRKDVHDILAASRDARRAIIVGGGLLGLEAARGLAQRGLDVKVVHLVDRVMERQLDGPAARLLERALRRLGIDVMLERLATEVLGDERVEGLRFAWGDDLRGEMIVVSAGIRPEVALADGMGVEVNRGVMVDDAMRTSVPGVFAVGECVEHRGVVHGLWGPLREQSRVAGAAIAGVPAAFHGGAPVTRLKVAEIDLFCAGIHSAETDDDEEVVALNTRAGVYRKLVLRGDRLVGAILLGDTRLGPRIAELLASGAPVPPEFLETDQGPAPWSDCGGDDTLVCACNAVTRGRILEVAREQDLSEVDEVARATGAATGCGSCRHNVASLLQDAAAKR
jgi:NAD(P)H-nitrite reductase large subunit